MLQRTLHSDDVRVLLDEVDDEILDEILEVGASWEEIAEAARLAQHIGPTARLPSSPLVAQLHRILFELLAPRHRGVVRVELYVE